MKLFKICFFYYFLLSAVLAGINHSLHAADNYFYQLDEHDPLAIDFNIQEWQISPSTSLRGSESPKGEHLQPMAKEAWEIGTLHQQTEETAENKQVPAQLICPLACTKPSIVFQVYKALWEHFKINHITIIDGAYPCPIKGCPEKFAQSTQLKNHIAHIHYNLESYQCRNYGCKRTFFSGQGRNKHEVKCKSEDSICLCGACARNLEPIKFDTPADLWNHAEKEHFAAMLAINGEASCSWKECYFKTDGSNYNCAEVIKSHMASKHIKYRYLKCEICKAGFFNRQSRGRHMKKHSKQKEKTTYGDDYTEKISKLHENDNLDKSPGENGINLHDETKQIYQYYDKQEPKKRPYHEDEKASHTSQNTGPQRKRAKLSTKSSESTVSSNSLPLPELYLYSLPPTNPQSMLPTHMEYFQNSLEQTKENWQNSATVQYSPLQPYFASYYPHQLVQPPDITHVATRPASQGNTSFGGYAPAMSNQQAPLFNQPISQGYPIPYDQTQVVYQCIWDNCGEGPYENEDALTNHYEKYHEIDKCQYPFNCKANDCREIGFVSANALWNHVKKRHISNRR